MGVFDDFEVIKCLSHWLLVLWTNSFLQGQTGQNISNNRTDRAQFWGPVVFCQLCRSGFKPFRLWHTDFPYGIGLRFSPRAWASTGRHRRRYHYFLCLPERNLRTMSKWIYLQRWWLSPRHIGGHPGAGCGSHCTRCWNCIPGILFHKRNLWYTGNACCDGAVTSAQGAETLKENPWTQWWKIKI